MGAKKNGRKKRAAWRKYKRQLSAAIRIQSAALQAVGAAQSMAAASKCARCVHTFAENGGGRIAPHAVGEAVDFVLKPGETIDTQIQKAGVSVEKTSNNVKQ